MKPIDAMIEIGFRCAICGAFSPVYELVRDHIRHKHPNQDERHIDQVAICGFKCAECDHFTTSAPEIRTHIRGAHQTAIKEVRGK